MGFFRSLYLTDRLFLFIATLVCVFVVGFFWPVWFTIASISLLTLWVVMAVDMLILYANREGFYARRQTMDKLSNGDNNEVNIVLQNRYQLPVFTRVIDEIPIQFQAGNIRFKVELGAGYTRNLQYFLRPTERGEYKFGAVNVYVSTHIGLVWRRYRFSQDQVVPVYPSYLQLRQYELMAISNRLTEMGVTSSWRPSSIIRACKGEQIEKYLLPTIRGERHDCLAMSEPNAGSDVRGMECRAERDGDEYVINGSKIWTSLGTYAKYMILLARTSTEGCLKNKGCTTLNLNMMHVALVLWLILGGSNHIILFDKPLIF